MHISQKDQSEADSRAGSISFASKLFFVFDINLIVLTVISLTALFLPFSAEITSVLTVVLAALSFLGLIPVVISAAKSLAKRQVSVDLLASVALAFSLLSYPVVFLQLSSP